jgi:hypothetical protein
VLCSQRGGGTNIRVTHRFYKSNKCNRHQFASRNYESEELLLLARLLLQALPLTSLRATYSFPRMCDSRVSQVTKQNVGDLESKNNAILSVVSGRGKMKNKKGGGLLLIPLFMAGTLIPIALAGLALLAGKALIISKLALVLAGIIGLKKLLSGSGGGYHHDSAYQVVGHGHHAAARSQPDPHLLAYSSYAPS